MQKALNNQRVADETQTARKSDDRQVLTKTIILRASAQYADANSVHEVCPSGANPTAEDSVAEVFGGVSEASVVVSAGDFELLNTLAGVGIEAGNWARDRVAEGNTVIAE